MVSLDLARKKRARKKGVPPEISAYFAELGRRSSSGAGGKATAANRTPEERSAAARKAVQARWAKAKAKADTTARRPPEEPPETTVVYNHHRGLVRDAPASEPLD